MPIDGDALYRKIKARGKEKFNEEKHCGMILRIMSDYNKGTFSAFCVENQISDFKFYQWLKQNEIFLECYAVGKMMARENWEAEGREIAREISLLGHATHRFEHWRMMGWSRYGIGKNSRIRLDLDPHGTPHEHYSQLLLQASQGDFTAGEIKQLMEAVNVGLNTHQVFKLQKEIDQLKFDLTTMTENTNVHNNVSNKRIEKKD